jgi:hypothetical protein
VAPPPSLFPPVELAPVMNTESREHNEQPADADPPPLARQRVVLLPHAQIAPPDTDPQTAAPDGPQE